MKKNTQEEGSGPKCVNLQTSENRLSGVTRGQVLWQITTDVLHNNFLLEISCSERLGGDRPLAREAYQAQRCGDGGVGASAWGWGPIHLGDGSDPPWASGGLHAPLYPWKVPVRHTATPWGVAFGASTQPQRPAHTALPGLSQALGREMRFFSTSDRALVSPFAVRPGQVRRNNLTSQL